MGAENERLVLDFIHAAYGERMDVDTMVSLVSDDFVYQLNVPRSPVITGREAARAVFEGSPRTRAAWWRGARSAP